MSDRKNILSSGFLPKFSLLLISALLFHQGTLADTLYKWQDKSGRVNITSSYPSKSLLKKGSKVRIINSDKPKENKVVIKTNTLSKEERREIAKRNQNLVTLKKEGKQLSEEKDYLEAKIKQTKVSILRLDKLSARADTDAEQKIKYMEKKEKMQGDLKSNTAKLHDIELRLLRLKQEGENLK